MKLGLLFMTYHIYIYRYNTNRKRLNRQKIIESVVRIIFEGEFSKTSGKHLSVELEDSVQLDALLDTLGSIMMMMI